MSQTPTYVGAIEIDGVIYPVLPGARFSLPENWAIPTIIGNYWNYNYGEGLTEPIIECSIAPLDDATYSVLRPAFLNALIAKSNDAANDVAALAGGINVYDGISKQAVSGCKLDGFQIAVAKGEDLTVNFRFKGTSVVSTTSGSPFVGAAGDLSPYWSTDTTKRKVLRFPQVTIDKPSGCTYWGFNIGFSNSLTPNLCLDGTRTPSEQNSGIQMCGFSGRIQNVSAATVRNQELGGSPGDGFKFHLTGNNVTTTFEIPNLLNNNPQDRNFIMPRFMRDYQYISLGSHGFGLAGDGAASYAPLRIY